MSHERDHPGHFCNIADSIDNLLLSEFGGTIAFVESTPSSLRH